MNAFVERNDIAFGFCGVQQDLPIRATAGGIAATAKMVRIHD
jgi:hypothetical protein